MAKQGSVDGIKVKDIVKAANEKKPDWAGAITLEPRKHPGDKLLSEFQKGFGGAKRGKAK